jgi:transposase
VGLLVAHYARPHTEILTVPAITAAHDGDIQMIDSTSVRVHQQAATAKRGIEIIVSVVPEAGSRPKSTRLSMGKASRSG